jgi:hypothetical protein
VVFAPVALAAPAHQISLAYFAATAPKFSSEHRLTSRSLHLAPEKSLDTLPLRVIQL